MGWWQISPIWLSLLLNFPTWCHDKSMWGCCERKSGKSESLSGALCFNLSTSAWLVPHVIVTMIIMLRLRFIFYPMRPDHNSMLPCPAASEVTSCGEGENVELWQDTDKGCLADRYPGSAHAHSKKGSSRFVDSDKFINPYHLILKNVWSLRKQRWLAVAWKQLVEWGLDVSHSAYTQQLESHSKHFI